MKFSRDDPRAAHMASDVIIDRAQLSEVLADRHRWVLATSRSDGRPQLSLVTGGLLPDGRLAVATYPERAKVRNTRREPHASVLAMGERFDSAWIQLDGNVEVLDMPAAADAFVEYFRAISGEHPDWDEYRSAIAEQGKCLLLIEPTRWGPLSSGGFPPSLFED